MTQSRAMNQRHYFTGLGARLLAWVVLSFASSGLTANEQTLTVTPETSVATAFLIAPNTLLTAYHAVKGRQQIFIASERDNVFTAAMVDGFSETFDIAILRASVKGSPLPIGSWPSFPQGAETYVIGFPKLGNLVSEKRITSGIFNGDQRFGNRQDWFQLSAEIHRGNSGSPVISADGAVYGLISHKLDAINAMDVFRDLPQNVNFALKSNRILEFLDAYQVRPTVKQFDATRAFRPLEIFQSTENSVFLVLSSNRP